MPWQIEIKSVACFENECYDLDFGRDNCDTLKVAADGVDIGREGLDNCLALFACKDAIDSCRRYGLLCRSIRDLGDSLGNRIHVKGSY